MHILEVTPAPCIHCGRGNVQGSDPIRFVDLERDINWNDPAILCEDCIAQLGGLVGMLSSETLTELKVQLRKKDEEIHDLKADKDSMRIRAKKLGMTFDTVTV